MKSGIVTLPTVKRLMRRIFGQDWAAGLSALPIWIVGVGVVGIEGVEGVGGVESVEGVEGNEDVEGRET